MIRLINDFTMSVIADLMDSELREKVHGELAPCTNEKFLARYCELDKKFACLLWQEFSINIDDLKTE